MMTYTEVLLKLQAMVSNGNGFNYLDYLRLVYSNVWTGLMYSFCTLVVFTSVVVIINTIVYYVKKYATELVMNN